jgi:NAD(P)-dependent dehydrogenase (short-subunit alcohol dehydrogenase family)
MKTAILTGATGTLGRKIAQQLAGVGVDLLLVGRRKHELLSLARELKAFGDIRIAPLEIDLREAGAPKAIMEHAVQFGGFDILINNAGILGPVGDSWEVDDRDFEETVKVNFLVPAALCRAAIPLLISRGAGWIINLSGGGATSPRERFAAYGSAKTALVRFGETLALECARHSIRVNSVAPGAFRSRMTEQVLGAGNAGGHEERIAEDLLTNDSGAADKASELVSYLVAGDGVDITGKIISAVWDNWQDLHRQDARPEAYTLRRIT